MKKPNDTITPIARIGSYNPAQEGIDALRAENEAQRMMDHYRAIYKTLKKLQVEIETESLPMSVDIPEALIAVQKVMDLVSECESTLKELSDDGDI